MRALEEEKAGKEAEIERLRVELEEIDGNVAKGAEEKRRMREQYEEKVRRVQGQLRKLQVQKSESDALRTEKEKTKSVAKVRELETEVGRMRSMQETLKRKLREREAANNAAQEEQTREIGALKRNAETQMKRIKELEGDKERHRMALRKKTDELAAAQRKLQLLGGGDDAHDDGHDPSPSPRPASGRKLSTRERAHAYGEHVKSRGVGVAGSRVGGFGDRPPTAPVAVDVKQLAEIIERETARALKQRAGEEELKRAEAKRVAVAAERDAAIKERDALELRKERVAASLERDHDELVAVLDGLDDALGAIERLGDAASPAELARAEELRDRRRAAASRTASLESKIASGRVLPEEDERALRELEDRIDGLDAEAEYVAASLADALRDRDAAARPGAARKKGSPGGGGGAADLSRFGDAVAELGSAEARAALSVALDKVVSLQLHERDGQSRAAELEMQLSDAQSAIEEMESGLRMKEMEYDRRVTELQREHSRKEAYLLKLSNAAAMKEAAEMRSGATAAAGTAPSPRSAGDASTPPSDPDPVSAAAADLRSQMEFRETQVAVLTKEHGAMKTQNKELKRRVKALLAEREEMEEAAAKLEERLESSGRAAQSLQEQVHRLSSENRRSQRNAPPNVDVHDDDALPAMASPPLPVRTDKLSSMFRGGGGGGGGGGGRGSLPATPAGAGAVRVSRAQLRPVSIEEVEATRASRISNPGGVKMGATARPSSSVARRLSENDSP
jgi:chromosome segregation ATPase